MAEPTHDFGPLDELKPEAIGRPGQRRFRILFRKGNRVACFWMEKEQLGALGDAVHELLGQVTGGAGPHNPRPTGSFPEPFEFEAQTGRLALGYNEASDLFLLLLFDIETELEVEEKVEGEEEMESTNAEINPTIRCEVSRSQLERFYNEAAAVIQSGRPPKPSKNGHFKAD